MPVYTGGSTVMGMLNAALCRRCAPEDAYVHFSVAPEVPAARNTAAGGSDVWPTAQSFNAANHCTLYHGNPRQLSGRVAEGALVDNINDYTMSPDWKWTDNTMGPFVLATMGTFVTAIVKYRGDVTAPSFALANVGAGLWLMGLVLQLCNVVEFRMKARARTDIAAHFFAYSIAVIAIVLAAIIGTDK
jgi:hypothetical protein